MATASVIKDDFLTCTICFEVYVKPTSLPCLHTFCLKCLSSHIVAEEERYGVIRRRGFPCPLCRSVASIKDPSWKPLEKWAEEFKSNFFIENLISTMKIKRSTSIEESQKKEEKMKSDASARRSEWSTRDESSSDGEVTGRPGGSTLFFSSSFSIYNDSDENYIHVTNLPQPYELKEYETLKVLSASLPSDFKDTKLTGICVVSDVIVTLDFENKAVKSFSNWRASLDVNIMPGLVLLPSTPQSVTKMSSSKVVVSIPDRRLLYVLKVIPVLEKMSAINTARRYEHIAHIDSSTFVAVAEKPRTRVQEFPIDIVNYEGITLKSVKLSRSLHGIFYRDVAVSDSGLVHLLPIHEMTTYCMTQDGLELYRYTQPQESNPQNTRGNNKPPCNIPGLCCISDNLYTTDVLDCSVSESCCDSGLPATSEKIITAKHGLVQPTGIDVMPDGTVFVACWDGYVRVYVNKRNRPVVKPVVKIARETAV